MRGVSTLTDIPGTLFAHAHPGFMVIDFHTTPAGEEVRLQVVESGHEQAALSTPLAIPRSSGVNPREGPLPDSLPRSDCGPHARRRALS